MLRCPICGSADIGDEYECQDCGYIIGQDERDEEE